MLGRQNQHAAPNFGLSGHQLALRRVGVIGLVVSRSV